MRRILALILAAGCWMVPAGPGWGCWAGIDPAAFAGRCPVIVTGTITRIEPACPRDVLGYDIAHITVAAVHKNVLKDLSLKPGGVIRVRMSARGARLKMSTDLSYPLHTRALWLIVLRPDGHFAVNAHPVQCQPTDAVKEGTRREVRVIKAGGGRPTGEYTRAEWIARMKDGKDRKRGESRCPAATSSSRTRTTREAGGMTLVPAATRS